MHQTVTEEMIKPAISRWFIHQLHRKTAWIRFLFVSHVAQSYNQAFKNKSWVLIRCTLPRKSLVKGERFIRMSIGDQIRSTDAAAFIEWRMKTIHLRMTHLPWYFLLISAYLQLLFKKNCSRLSRTVLGSIPWFLKLQFPNVIRHLLCLLLNKVNDAEYETSIQWHCLILSTELLPRKIFR